jgi:hypothetical protein
MQDRNVNKMCHDENCRHMDRQHFHVLTNSGNYVKFIVEKPKKKPYD